MKKNRKTIKNKYIEGYSGTTGYGEAGASHTKKSFKGFNATSSSPNSDINYNLYDLRNRSRMLFMSGGLGTAAIKTTSTNVVGVGLIPNPQVDFEFLGMTSEDAKAWGKKVTRYWDLWAKKKANCDIRGMSNFYGLQKVALMGALMSGDSFALVKRAKRTKQNPISLRLDVIEADLISTPTKLKEGKYFKCTTDGIANNGNEIFNGVEVDNNGSIVAYYVSDKYPKETILYSQETKWTRIPAYGELTNSPNILHVCDIERGGQYRGVPFLAQVIEPLLQMRRYTESELMAALVNSFFTAFITTEKETNVLTDDENNENNNPKEDELTMGPGMINQLAPGENISFGDPKHPNSGFDLFMMTLAKLIGASLEIPAEVILKAFNSNYSASRAALQEAWKMFSNRRVWFVEDFCQPTWELFVDELVALNYISAPGYFDNPLIRQAYLNCRWNGTMQPQLDPIKEVQAEILKVENGFTTRKEATIRLNGGSFDENVSQLELENSIFQATKTDIKEEEDDKEEITNDNSSKR